MIFKKYPLVIPLFISFSLFLQNEKHYLVIKIYSLKQI